MKIMENVAEKVCGGNPKKEEVKTEEAWTKPKNASGVFPAKRRLVKTMMLDSIVGSVSSFCSSSEDSQSSNGSSSVKITTPPPISKHPKKTKAIFPSAP